jgi:succinyl-CoA synthetase beta subunit
MYVGITGRDNAQSNATVAASSACGTDVEEVAAQNLTLEQPLTYVQEQTSNACEETT